MSSYVPSKRTRVSGSNIKYVHQLLLQKARSAVTPAPLVVNTENESSYEYDCGDYIDFDDEQETNEHATSDVLENEDQSDFPDFLFVDPATTTENDNTILEDTDQVDGDIKYKLNVPKFPFTTIERYSIMFEEVCDTYNISREGSRALRHLINMMIADNTLDCTNKLLSHDTCNSLVKNAVPLAMTRKFDICINACYLYSTEDIHLLNCPVCHTARSSAKVTKMISISDKIVEMLLSDEIRTNLIERQVEVAEHITRTSDTYADIYDGDIFRSLYNNQIINNDENILNIYLKVDIDGFTSSSSHSSMVMVHAVILNLDSSERYKRNATFQIAVLPGKSKADFNSFLKPIVDEIKMLSEKTIVIQTDNSETPIRCKVYLLFVNGDGIECNRLMNFSGHTGTFGCRFCLSHGLHRVEGPPNTRRSGMYFPNRDAPLRSKESLLLEDTSSIYQNNTYGIKKPTIFGSLNTYTGSCMFGFDELHGISNVAKLLFDLISPRYNTSFKFYGNESLYPFQLSNAKFDCLNTSMQKSRMYIPAGVFQGSFHPVNPLNVKSLYRSIDWITWLVFVVPTLVVGLFDDADIRVAVLALTRACSISLQWVVSKDDILEIESSLEKWYRCIDQYIANNALSKSVYKSSMHHLFHIPQIIRQCSSLRNISVRSMEREIGNYKKKMRARVDAEANALNVIERIARFKFLDTTKMMDFSTLYNRNPQSQSKGFIYHPLTYIDNCKDYPQLWEPFSSPVIISRNSAVDSSIEGLIRMDKFIQAISSYKRRYLGITKGRPLTLNLDMEITPAAKLWLDSHVQTSTLFKKKHPSRNNRGGEYIMFESSVKKRVRNRLQSISNWYVAKVLFFFEIDLELPESRSCGSFYAVVEVMKSHKTSPYSKCIPLVHPFPANETKKYAVIDVGDILSVVGLIQKTDLVNNQAQSSNWFYVISPSTAFDRDMSINTGKISDLL